MREEEKGGKVNKKEGKGVTYKIVSLTDHQKYFFRTECAAHGATATSLNTLFGWSPRPSLAY